MRLVFIFLIIIFLINLVGMYNQWYLTFSWFDQLLHFSGGFLVAIFMAIYLKDHLFDHAKLKDALIIIGAVSFIGIIWEFTEYIANLALSPAIYSAYGIKTYFMGDLNDTINDLLMDILGGGVIASTFHWFKNKTSKNPEV